MKRKETPRGDVSWTIPGRKIPIAYSTVSTSYLIAALSKKYNTIREVFNAVNFDIEAKAVLQCYIDAGFGNQIAREWFR